MNNALWDRVRRVGSETWKQPESASFCVLKNRFHTNCTSAVERNKMIIYLRACCNIDKLGKLSDQIKTAFF